MTGVVVDVDDTLYLERDYVRSGFRVVGDWCRAELGAHGVGERAWRLFVEGRRGTTLTDALEAEGVEVDRELREAVVDVYRRHLPDITLLPDAERLIARVGAQRRLGVVTDGPGSSQRAKCAALDLFGPADPVVITAELGTSKPDPAVFLRVADAWRLPAGSLVYVADNPAKDFVAPLALGWRAVRVRRPWSLHQGAETPPGVVEVVDLDELDLDGL